MNQFENESFGTLIIGHNRAKDHRTYGYRREGLYVEIAGDSYTAVSVDLIPAIIDKLQSIYDAYSSREALKALPDGTLFQAIGTELVNAKIRGRYYFLTGQGYTEEDFPPSYKFEVVE